MIWFFKLEVVDSRNEMSLSLDPERSNQTFVQTQNNVRETMIQAMIEAGSCIEARRCLALAMARRLIPWTSRGLVVALTNPIEPFE